MTSSNDYWLLCRFGDVVRFVNWRAYSQHEMLSAGTPLLRIQNLNGGKNWFFSDLELPEDKYCEAGDLLYAWSATFGPYWWRGPRAIFHYHIWNVKPSGAIDQRFAYYELLRITDDIRRAAHGVAMPHITKGGMEAWQIRLPAIPEQKRIADNLDTVLARVDACRDRLDRVAAILKRFRQSVLANATSGKLTEEWRETRTRFEEVRFDRLPSDRTARASSLVDSPLPTAWRWATFGEFVSSFRSGTSDVPQNEPTAFPILRSSSVRPGSADLSDVRFLPSCAKIRQDDLLADGDLLFTRLSGSLDYVANCAVVRGLGDRRVFYPDRLFRAKLTQPSSAPYLELCFGSPGLRRHLIVEAKSSAGHQRVSMGAVTGFPIPLPPQSEQSEIVRRVDSLFAWADRLEAHHAAARAQVERLTPALLAKAFRGELVPQDPADEPATELLERLGQRPADNSAAPQKRQGSKPRRAIAAQAAPSA